MKTKKGAMEMTVGTIVTIVLLMSALVLGLILTKSVFKSSQGAMELTDEQLMTEIGQVFGSEDEVIAIYPNSKELTIKVEERDAIGLGIKNLGGTSAFSYKVEVKDDSKCGNNYDAKNWIYIGGSGSNIKIDVGDTYVTKILFEIPANAPICLVQYKITVTQGTSSKLGEFYITSKA